MARELDDTPDNKELAMRNGVPTHPCPRCNADGILVESTDPESSVECGLCGGTGEIER